jgi:YgiT-type zinc finger domain-containing protein
MIQSCSFCGNKNIKNTQVEYTYKHDGKYMIFHNVPALQCEFCGEKYFEANILKKIEEQFISIQNGKKASSEISVAVEDFDKLVA